MTCGWTPTAVLALADSTSIRPDCAMRIDPYPHWHCGTVPERAALRSKTEKPPWRMLRSKLVELKEREMAEKHAELKGEMKKIEWGSQIRSYVFHPYTMVKDHRTGAESGNITAVMDGDLDLFITEYLMKS